MLDIPADRAPRRVWLGPLCACSAALFLTMLHVTGAEAPLPGSGASAMETGPAMEGRVQAALLQAG